MLWGLPRLRTMSGRDRSRPWGAAEADVMTCRSSHFGTDGLSQGSADCRRVQNNSQPVWLRNQGEDQHSSHTAWGSIECFAFRHARHHFSVPRTAQQFVDLRSASPPSPSVPPRCDQPTHRISDVSPNSPDRALRFTAIQASERFRGLKEGRGAVFRAVRPAPPIRHHKRESAERPSRCAARADSLTPPVNEKARLDFEAGLVSLPNSPERSGFKRRSSRLCLSES